MKIIKISISILIFLGVLEISLRFSGKLKTYSEKNFEVYQSAYNKTLNSHLYKWNKNDTVIIKQKEFSYSYFTNQYGIADIHNLDTCQKEKTILIIGDSFVFGVGAKSVNNLAHRLEDKTNYTFINAGIPGSDPFFETKLIEYLNSNINFSKIIMLINFSDINDYLFRGGNERFLENGTTQYKKAPWFEKYYQYSFIVRAFVNGVLKYDYTLLSKKDLLMEKQNALRDYTFLLNAINIKLNQNNQQLLIVLQPYARQYANNNSVLSEVLNYEYLNDLERDLKHENIKTINLDKRMSKIINANNYLDYSWALDGHYNAKGYELLANSILEEIAIHYPKFLE